MDPNEIADWCAFCEGKGDFDIRHFSTLLMEFFLEKPYDEDVLALHTVFRYVPDSERALAMLLRLDHRAEDKTDNDILALVKRDLGEKRRIIEAMGGPDALIDVIQSDGCLITLDEAEFDKARNSNLNGHFFHCISSFMMQHLADCDKRIAALDNAFYGVASNLQLQWTLTAALMRLEVDLSNYFELYDVGVDYAIDEDGVLIMNYRAAMDSVSRSDRDS